MRHGGDATDGFILSPKEGTLVLKEFRDFVLRGNLVELATAVVIGVAFNAVVQAIVDKLITPFIAALGGTDSPGLGFYLRDGNQATFVDFGAVIGAIISFLVTAAVVFFVFVKPFNTLSARLAPKADPEQPAKADDVVLLEQIRDLLREQRQV